MHGNMQGNTHDALEAWQVSAMRSGKEARATRRVLPPVLAAVEEREGGPVELNSDVVS